MHFLTTLNHQHPQRNRKSGRCQEVFLSFFGGFLVCGRTPELVDPIVVAAAVDYYRLRHNGGVQVGRSQRGSQTVNRFSNFAPGIRALSKTSVRYPGVRAARTPTRRGAGGKFFAASYLAYKSGAVSSVTGAPSEPGSSRFSDRKMSRSSGVNCFSVWALESNACRSSGVMSRSCRKPFINCC